jgi:hypothetical protein
MCCGGAEDSAGPMKLLAMHAQYLWMEVYIQICVRDLSQRRLHRLFLAVVHPLRPDDQVYICRLEADLVWLECIVENCKLVVERIVCQQSSFLAHVCGNDVEVSANKMTQL